MTLHSSLVVSGGLSSRLWTPDQGAAGLLVVARLRPLAAVVGGRIIEVGASGRAAPQGGGRSVTPGGLFIVSSSRKKEPTRIVGHPDLASGASVQRGDTLYVSIAEAVYRESRGDQVELHFTPTDEDAEALQDLRARARSRWENDRLPDGWTRPLPPPPTPKTEGAGSLPPDLQALAEEIRDRQESRFRE